MKKKIKNALYILLAFVILQSCSEGHDGSKYDGLILTDPLTQKVYILNHNMNDGYFINEQFVKISGTDTTYVFE